MSNRLREGLEMKVEDIPAIYQKDLAATQTHYDRYTFDLDTEERAKTKMEKALLGQFLRQSELGAEDTIVDIGCGAGVISSLVKKRYGVTPIGLDLSFVSAQRAKERGIQIVQGSNLSLPFQDGFTDFIISNGVIQMTPDPYQSFAELCRILKPGGRLFLSIYNKKSLYYIIYNGLGAPCRLVRAMGGEWIVRHILFPLFYLPLLLGNLLILGAARRIPTPMAWNLFNDQLMAPQAKFYTFKNVEVWARAQGLKCLAKRTESVGFMLSFIFQKL
jgi:ubiquinone/menaquinone biosynthesis C-methylase UbiE